MTPKEKAKELVTMFSSKLPWYSQKDNLNKSKQCAIIAVDEILNAEPRCPSDVDWDDVGGTHQYYYEAQREEAEKFWQEVKQEIEKL